MRTDKDNRKTARLNDYKCSKPDHVDTAHENEAMDDEFTSGENPDTNYRKYCSHFEDSYQIIESGLNLAEDNTPYPTYDDANPFNSYNLDNEDDRYNCPPYRNFEY